MSLQATSLVVVDFNELSFSLSLYFFLQSFGCHEMLHDPDSNDVITSLTFSYSFLIFSFPTHFFSMSYLFLFLSNSFPVSRTVSRLVVPRITSMLPWKSTVQHSSDDYGRETIRTEKMMMRMEIGNDFGCIKNVFVSQVISTFRNPFVGRRRAFSFFVTVQLQCCYEIKVLHPSSSHMSHTSLRHPHDIMTDKQMPNNRVWDLMRLLLSFLFFAIVFSWDPPNQGQDYFLKISLVRAWNAHNSHRCLMKESLFVSY